MQRDDQATLLDIRQACERCLAGIEGLNQSSFLTDWKPQSVVLHQLMLLGEATKRLSPEFRERHRGIAWREWAGLRDILIHAYDTVDTETVWTIASTEVRPLLDQILLIQRTEAEQ
jgi:uncharacterized protein with HEPN domain